MATEVVDETGADNVQIPSTPPPTDQHDPIDILIQDKSSISPRAALSSSMTPPPSSQPVGATSPSKRAALAELELTPTSFRIEASKNLPSPEQVNSANMEELRDMVQELVNAVTKARMSAAHFKLQHNLLSIETTEAAQRAEVEQQMSRREIEALQATSEHRHRNRMLSTPRTSAQPVSAQVEQLTRTCKDLEIQRDEMEVCWEETKKELENERFRVEVLEAETAMLKERIRQNREHFSRIQGHSPAYSTPRRQFMTPQRSNYSQKPAHATFADIIEADKILSQNSASVPSTPTKVNAPQFTPGHSRGAQSLSSLHNSQYGSRPVTSDGYPSRVTFSAPGSQLINESAERERHDRDSTISVSDTEELPNEEIPQSQASSLATDMLRKNPASQESIRQSQEAERSSKYLQTKLFGNVKKAGATTPKGKRGHDFDHNVTTVKKVKNSDAVGLGIEA